MNMLNMLRAFFALLLSLGFATPLLAADASVLMEQVTLTKVSPSLARAWSRHDMAYKKAHPWKEVWEVNCARTGIPCTESAWRTQVQPGTVVYLPAPTIVVLAPTAGSAPEAIALVPSAIPGVLAVAPSAPLVIAEQINTRKQLQSAIGNVAVLEKSVKQSEGLVTFLGMLLFVSVVALTIVARRRKVTGDDVSWMRNRISDLEEDIATVTRDRDRLRAPTHVPANMTIVPCEVLQMPQAVEPSAPHTHRTAVAVRSIELTFQVEGSRTTACDANGACYVLDECAVERTSVMKHGDKFFADVSADNRVVRVLMKTSGAPPNQDTM